MFDLDDFLSRCEEAISESEPRRAIREVLERSVADPTAVAEALAPTEGGITLMHHTDDLTVLHVVWAPGMRIFPHNHEMWAAIGIYAGQEDNEFFRRRRDADGPTLTESGGKRLVTGDTVLLGDDTIHSVTNPASVLTGAIHIYGGDFVNQPRSQWGPGDLTERPYDIDQTRSVFAAANDAWRASLEAG